MESDVSIYDLMAASMLGIFSVWLWSQIVNLFFQTAEASSPYILAISYYVVCGGIISFLALRKLQSKEILDGIKIGGVISIASAVYVFLTLGEFSSLIVVLFIGFPLGGYLGAILRKR
ncbi:MAG: hypothetical protein PVJ38_02450 [Candidatus Bathyarchaeota archaeon]|jgi:hypothetical protein